MLFACLAGSPAAGQRATLQELASLDLEALANVPVVSAARHEQRREDSPRAISVITAEEIRRGNFRNIPEALVEMAGVFLQQTNYAGGSPIIRGMIGNRILILVDGVRLNNSSYRLGPNQYLNFIDVRRVERIEVIRGNGSVLYGSDAMGGIVNIITKRAPEPTGGAELHGSAGVRFGSADRSGQGRVDLGGTWRGVGFAAGFTKDGFGDLSSGQGIRQDYTGYRQEAFDFSTSFRVGRNRTIRVGADRLTQRDVPRTDVLAARSDLEYVWDREGREALSIEYEQRGFRRFIESLRVTGTLQHQFEDLNRRAVATPNVRSFLSDSIVTGNYGLQLASRGGRRHYLTYGVEGFQDRIGSLRRDALLSGVPLPPQRGNFADGGKFLNAGLFLQDEVEITPRLLATAGVRLDRASYLAALHDPLTGEIGVNQATTARTGSAYLLYRLTSRFDVTGGVSKGFRTPSLEDTTLLRLTGTRLEVPNPALKPESSNNYEASLRLRKGPVKASVSGYYSTFDDLIDRSPSLFRDLPYLDVNGNGRKEPAEPSIFARTNVGHATVRGLGADAQVRISGAWSAQGMFNWTKGDDRTARAPLSRIPPLNGLAKLSWTRKGTAWADAVFQAADGQLRLSPGDLLDVRIGPNGTAGFGVAHLRFGLERSALAGLVLSLENLTDRRYRFHGSGVYRPGRSVVLGYQRRF